MDNQQYYKLMASYLSKRNCDESFMRYFFGKNSAKKSPEELERADERKRRLQRERSRRYRALKNARRQPSCGGKEEAPRGTLAPALEDEPSDADEPPTLCHLMYASSDCASDDNCAPSPSAGAHSRDPSRALAELLTQPNTELDYPTVHSLMFHWLQT